MLTEVQPRDLMIDSALVSVSAARAMFESYQPSIATEYTIERNANGSGPIYIT